MNSENSSSWKFSILSFGLTLFLTLSVLQWHSTTTSGRRANSTPTTTISTITKRFLPVQGAPLPPKADDDVTRDEICRQYLFNFLNGTTDAQDECDGMYHAFEAADCAADESVLQQQGEQKHDRHTLRNNNNNQDVEFWRMVGHPHNNKHVVGHPHKHDDGNVTDDHVVMDDYYEKWGCCSSIYRYYTRHCHQTKMPSTKLLGLVLIMVVCSGIKGLLRTFGWDWIPDAAACIVVGAIAGCALRLISPTMINEKISFSNDLFLRILLPPIVFQSALSIDKRAFRRDLFPILTFAIIGTGFSAIVIGLITYYLTEFGGTSLPLLDSLLFGSLISSIDPVATLGILQGVGVNPTETLYTLIFGESLLNDGVAIVLFETLVRHLGDKNVVSKATIQETLGRFAMVSFGSIAIGLVCGLICTLYFMTLRGKHSAVTEVAVFFSWALVPYYVSDGVGLSGIIAIMAMGFFMDYYVIGGFQSEEVEWMDYMELRREQQIQEAIDATEYEGTCGRCRCCCCCCKAFSKAFSGCGHLSSRSRKHVGFVTEVIASVMETAIFAYLGLFLFQDHSWNMRLDGIAIFGCVLSRAAMVVLLSLLINFLVWIDLENRLSRIALLLYCNSVPEDDESSTASVTKSYLDKKTQCIILLAGVRGAVSFALVENIPVFDAVTKHGSKYKAELKAMTASSILITLFVFGALTYFTVRSHSATPATPAAAVAESLNLLGRPTHLRLLSGPLTSTIEEDRGDDDGSSESSSEAVTQRQGTRRPRDSSHR